MYFIPIGLLVKLGAPALFWAAVGKTAADHTNLTWGNFFLANLWPATIGNIIGDSTMAGLQEWLAERRAR
jgi:formate transporter